MVVALPPFLVEIIKFVTSESFVKAAIFPGAAFVAVLGILSVWYERKLLARVMLRIGPFHVGKYGGWLQVIADAVKFLSKEFIIPARARKKLFVTMPLTGLFLSAMLFAFIPFSEYWVIFRSDIGVLLVFVFIAVSPIPLILAGWASGSKYSFVGMIRFAFQIFAYEIPLFIALTGVIIAARSFDIVNIVNAQTSLPFIVTQFIGFLVFFIAAVSEAERIPFDLPTAEQELVEGWIVEYGGVGFLGIQLAMYTKLDALLFLTVNLYLGGWHGPAIPGIPESILHPMWVFIKFLVLLTIVFLFRGVYTRITMRKILDLGWRFLIPLGFINLFIVSLTIYLPTLLA
ncbi:MAG: NADH-quinone oxidoreductase subunit H [Candidatus Caldarchaeum sp.]|nr:NADH-quinone oxidoreductase subunit H [Candidatus Caldarchaeum sp.]MDW8436026.1 complex I subunit 1 family protein [Candidatus Caldarchaeum sp.]